MNLAASGRHRPRLLVCHDLQQASLPGDGAVTPSRAQRALGNCRRILRHARAWDWSIVHAHRRLSGSGGRPIAGLAPRPSEPVMTRQGLSAFSNPSFRDLVGGAREAQIVLIGFCLASSCLATLFSAYDLGLLTLLVEDAVTTGREAAGAHAESLAKTIAAPFAEFSSTDDLIGARPAPRLVVG